MRSGKLISLSTMREIVVPECAVGRMVRYTGDMANSPGIGAVVAIRPAGPFSAYKSYDVALEDGREMLGTFLDGSRWQVLDEHAVGATLDILRAGVAARKATDQAAKSSAEQAFAAAVAKLRADYPHLTQGSGPVVAAKNMRVELKRAFPGIKFSVKTSQYSGGDSVRIYWADGPAAVQVERITNKYSGGSFDGMTDSYNHKHSPWTEVYGDAKYIFFEREYTDAAVASAIRTVTERYRFDGIEPPSVQDWRQGKAWGKSPIVGATHHNDWQSLISRELSKRTWTMGAL
jgi:hypothetical protein